MHGVPLSLLIGYLLGSIPPGYLFGRVVKGIDIRTAGNRGTGATNTYNLVGPAYGVMAALFDIAKGSLAYLLAVRWLGVAPDLSIIAGLAAVIGHIFPFTLGFRGGKGMATLLGLVATVLIYGQSWYALILTVSGFIYILHISSRFRWEWSARKLLKLCALVIPLGFLNAPGLVTAFVTYALAALVLLEIVRLANHAANRWYLRHSSFAKVKETSRLSGYTLFLISAVVVLLWFPRDIAAMALTFFVLADTAGPIGGAMFPHGEITHGKNVGGAMLIFAACFLAGLFLRSLAGLDISVSFIAFGALAVVVLDAFSFLVDDNLLIPVGSALAMRLLR